ncbi:MAG TPA: hypothetical protein VLF21_02485 [Candidatus Saccharimonadales bacterium]|nr:hypothetical protein [Candidatus Saccharimonadales bacterium]
MTEDPNIRVLRSEFALFGCPGRPTDGEAFARDQARLKGQREAEERRLGEDHEHDDASDA